ncbi:hypothetical protein [Cellulosimicrobium cellulans]|uniref:hypothetical protein n=1 Tax=Cellulosimicrobium cellulans TaxID=1710 RepID=UPI00130E93F4|nr:hypothetical protein [Cellulosimicrobium cellulans]
MADIVVLAVPFVVVGAVGFGVILWLRRRSPAAPSGAGRTMFRVYLGIAAVAAVLFVPLAIAAWSAP